jgi:hypothetical protein
MINEQDYDLQHGDRVRCFKVQSTYFRQGTRTQHTISLYISVRVADYGVLTSNHSIPCIAIKLRKVFKFNTAILDYSCGKLLVFILRTFFKIQVFKYFGILESYSLSNGKKDYRQFKQHSLSTFKVKKSKNHFR